MNKFKLANLKHTLYILCLLFVCSCQNENLPAFNDAEITKIGFYHRYYGSDKDPLTGENIMLEKELSCKYTINSENAIATVEVTVPQASNKFTEAERAKVVQNKLWAYFNISTAARVTPLDGAPKLGTPGDWTKTYKYLIKAADGTEKIWSVSLSVFKK